MAKMSGQGVRTHHWRTAERGMCQAFRMKLQGLLALVNDFHSDNISEQDMLSSGCDVHECSVLLLEGVRIALRRLSVWGIRMELIQISLHAPSPPGEESLHFAHGEELYPVGIPPHPDISHPDGKGGRSVRRHFTSGYPIAGWERRTLQLLQIDISGSSDNAYLQSFSLSIQCSGVLLNLPDISNRHFEIFWDILLQIFVV